MLIGVVIGVVSHGPDYMMMFIMVFAVTSSGSVFSVHEKSHSDKLYGILPLNKPEMILGRYLFALIIGAAYIAVAGILGFVMSKLMSGNLDELSYWVTLAIIFNYYSQNGFCQQSRSYYQVFHGPCVSGTDLWPFGRSNLDGSFRTDRKPDLHT